MSYGPLRGTTANTQLEEAHYWVRIEKGKILTLDYEQLRSITLNDEALIREALELLLVDAAEHIEKLRLASERADYKECERLAHCMLGVCGNIGAQSLATLFRTFERSVASGEIGDRELLLERLTVELENLRRAAVIVAAEHAKVGRPDPSPGAGHEFYSPGMDLGLTALALELGSGVSPEPTPHRSSEDRTSPLTSL